MASLANLTETNLAKLLFQAVAWANIADNTATAPATNLYVSLHNADPLEGGTQATSETAYTNYARQAVVRSAAGFAVSGNNPCLVQNVGAINFPLCGITGDTLTYWGIGLAVSGAGTLLLSGPIGPGQAYAFTASLASPGHLQVPGSALVVNQRVMLYGLGPAATLPTGTTEGTVYFVGTVTGTDVTLSTTTANGAPVNTSTVGAGIIIPCVPLVVSQNVTPSFAASALSAYFN